MGRPKLLLPWGKTSILGHLLDQWDQLSPGQVAIVIAGTDEALPRELHRLGSQANLLPNPDPSRGMFSSIQVAATWPHWNPQLTRWLISLGDQPLVQPRTLQRLIDESTAHPSHICQPARQGRPRHPVLLPASHFRQLATTSEINLKQFLVAREEQRHIFEVDDPGLDFDLDYPADYERARQLMTAL
jgi:molybdenum cofactor cytidylyltransferase